MTTKQINNISFLDAMNVLKENKVAFKFTFQTKESEVKAAARKILRDKKKGRI